MSFDRGDRVMATEDFGGFFGGKIPKGTTGVVTEGPGIFSSSVTVRFENGETESGVAESQIAKI